MTIGKYVSSLLPSFDKSRVEEDIRVLNEELRENTLPPYKAASEHFSREKLGARDTQEFDRTFSRNVNLERALQGRYPISIYRILDRSVETLGVLENEVDKLFGRDIAAGGLTYTRANLLKLLEVLSFSAKYARKLLIWTYMEEKRALGREVGEPFTKAETQWMYENRNTFFSAMTVLARKPSEISGALKNIPDMVVVPDEVDIAEQTVGSNRLDPLRMGIIPIKLNPIYHIRMAISEFQVARFKAGTEERRALEYRLLALKELKEGHEDARLEQEIQYTENRIKKLNHKLAKMEEE